MGGGGQTTIKMPSPLGEGQTDRLDYDANQGEVSGHADHSVYQGEVFLISLGIIKALCFKKKLNNKVNHRL